MTTKHEIKLSFKAINTNLLTAASKMCGCSFPQDNFCDSIKFQTQIAALAEHCGMQAYSFDLISPVELHITIWALGLFRFKRQTIRKMKQRYGIEINILDYKMENIGCATDQDVVCA